MKPNLITKLYKGIFPNYTWIINKEIAGNQILLNIGFSGGYTEQFLDLNVINHIAVDIVKPKFKPKGFWDKNYFDKFVEFHLYDVRKGLLKKFREKIMDCVMALDFIEHLTKEEGKKFLDEIDKIAIDKIIILTPNGFEQNRKTGFLENEKYMKHCSGWTVEDFEKRGYKVIGVRGHRFFYNKEGMPKNILYAIFGKISSWIVNDPKKSISLLCIKTYD